LQGEVIQHVKEIWEFDLVQKCFEEIKFQLFFPHIDYYMNGIDNIIKSDFVPSNEDIVRCRQATIGASTTTFWREKFWWTIIDVGGHTPERVKWQNIVKDGINAMVYFVALDDFATDSVEEAGKTKMDITKLVWEEVVNSDSFGKECILLFLNKIDLFNEQIKIQRQYDIFKEKFPDYEGPQDADKAVEFIERQFIELVKERKEIYTHRTCAIDTTQMAVVWDAIRDNVFRQRIAVSGMQLVV